MTTPNKQTIGSAIKLYVFPSLISILAVMIWRDISELRSDVKALLAQSNIDKTKIENLERDVRSLESSVYHRSITNNVLPIQTVDLRDKYFKQEEPDYTVKNEDDYV